MILHDGIDQGTPEWFEIRKGKMTGSNATPIGNAGAGLKTYIEDILLNLIIEQDRGYVSADMERGNRLEPLARLKYELERKTKVVEMGFVEYNKFVGISPDGLVFTDDMSKIIGGIEIKAKNDKNHLACLRTDKIDSGTLWQIQMNMLVTDAEWWDFISYNPNFKQSLYVQRVLPDQKKIDGLQKGFAMGETLLKAGIESQVILNELSIVNELVSAK